MTENSYFELLKYIVSYSIFDVLIFPSRGLYACTRTFVLMKNKIVDILFSAHGGFLAYFTLVNLTESRFVNHILQSVNKSPLNRQPTKSISLVMNINLNRVIGCQRNLHIF